MTWKSPRPLLSPKAGRGRLSPAFPAPNRTGGAKSSNIAEKQKIVLPIAHVTGKILRLYETDGGLA